MRKAELEATVGVRRTACDHHHPRPAGIWATRAMDTILGLLLGVLLFCWIGLARRKKDNGFKCTHHSECYSDCCLMNLEFGGAFCASKAAKSMPCLPQTKGALNIMCPCRLGLTCISRDLMCPRRCHWI